MRIRWNGKNAFPLLLLAFLYLAGAGHLAQRYSGCDSTLPDGLASGLQWVGSGLSWFREASSQLRLGSWLGNSWAPGSIGWRAASASPAKLPHPKPLSGFSSLTVQAADSFQSLHPRPTKIESLLVDAASESAEGLRVPDCGTRPLIVLAKPEVVIVTAEFPRLEISEVGLAALPDPPASAQLPVRSGCQMRPIGPHKSTI
ncbi:MAG: hypothetical protein V3T83_03130 [Acidobacteriota bacterium]